MPDPAPQPALRHPRWMSIALYLAAAYNLAWGAWVILFPNAYFHLIGMTPPNWPQLWQCLGMVIGVYGIGYAIAARDPLRHWPIILVGLLGKLLGPAGFLLSAIKGELPWSFGYTLLTNDMIWWAPFALILWRAKRE